ncbi:unnamed protein product [Cyprideis torosa]|uniref:Uncharacterized protein n=1 Tax=Cyprideis torosa TaxID=163714 RepID=A0A7R8W275_9CRUS|nr:unnamed protein product [Cyprideis torosa]CAG0881655.1 unnamed protein product [Cyprideis torosa]
MSHNSADDTATEPSSDSFWETGNYRRTTKRIEDGYKLCNELSNLLQERASLEKEYSASLTKWSKKWNDTIEKGPEYGTMEAAWKGLLAEADRVAEIHNHMKETLFRDITQEIKNWQREHFHKQMMHTIIKEKKEKEDEFKKAQKSWAKLHERVKKCKSDYHSACKNEKTQVIMLRNAEQDAGQSPEDLHKKRDKVDRAKNEVAKTKDAYETALKEISDANSRYMEDMTAVFDKCQEMEAERLRFFKDILFQVHQCLNISSNPELPQIYEELHHTVSNADDTKDLRWWSSNHGVNMPMNWPRFEEYVEEIRDITSKKGSSKTRPIPEDTNITLITQRTVTDDLPTQTAKGKTKGKINMKKADGSIAKETMENDVRKNPVTSNNINSTTQGLNGGGGGGGGERNPGGHNAGADDEDWDEFAEPLEDNGEPGVPVKALYDYDGMESDELSFKAGDVFEKLADEDDQGWCKGRKDNRVGLYPANYVELAR